MFWQKSRLTIISGVLIVIPIILGWVISHPHYFSWPIASIISLMIISLSCQLTKVFTVNIIVISGYLRYYCKSHYEKKMYKLNWDKNRKSTNYSIALYYLIISIVAVIIPIMVCRDNSGNFIYLIDWRFEITAFAVILLIYLYMLLKRKHPTNPVFENCFSDLCFAGIRPG
jgi:hypothetical protein